MTSSLECMVSLLSRCGDFYWVSTHSVACSITTCELATGGSRCPGKAGESSLALSKQQILSQCQSTRPLVEKHKGHSDKKA